MTAEVFDLFAARAARIAVPKLSNEQIVAIHLERALIDLPARVRAEAIARAERNLGQGQSMEVAKRKAIAWARCAIHPLVVA